MKISMDKKYRTRDGLPARIICTDRLGNAPIVALVRDKNGVEQPLTYTKRGTFYSSCPDERDLVEISPYEDFKIDDPVMVSHYENGPFYRRYFAGVTDSGRAQTFRGGQTSWTNDSSLIEWGYCRKPRPEEIQQITKKITTD